MRTSFLTCDTLDILDTHGATPSRVVPGRAR
jgi:hypothetical protein